MADYVRRLVSGDKARFKDDYLDLELDLVYLTDHIIIMGYPADGLEGLYRNKREDARRFLDHRHGKNYWIFNFCPIRENSYDPTFFGGRVSRYPFPDHHVPPLAIMPLVAREMRAWLKSSPDRVAVLHCKAGKGRSGTMACGYLLSLGDYPSAPKLRRSYTAKEWNKLRTSDTTAILPENTDEDTTQPPRPHSAPSPRSMSQSSITGIQSFLDTLTDVLDLHTSRRMKQPASPGKISKQGVSIASQRRWLYYWALTLAQTAPSHLWAIPSSPPAKRPKVRLTRLVLRMRPLSKATIGLVKAASKILEKTKMGKGLPENGNVHIWASLARYDDHFVEELEGLERQTRDKSGYMSVQKPGSELGQIFEGGKWDREKMVNCFARMGVVNEIVRETGENKDDKVDVFILRPLTVQASWSAFREEITLDAVDLLNLEEASFPSETSSMDDVTLNVKGYGVVLDACREVRIKLYNGQVFMGWMWFIPIFHMLPAEAGPTGLSLRRKELDFSLGIGSAIIDLEITLEWLGTIDSP